MLTCCLCLNKQAVSKRTLSSSPICKDCFIESVENDVFQYMRQSQMFRPSDVVAIGASGGKDSTVLIQILKKFNDQLPNDEKMKLHLVSIDEGIVGYRDHSLSTVKQNAIDYSLPLIILSYEQLFKTTMDEVVGKIGLTNNCTVCGVFRRKALDKASQDISATVIATGHNADDQAETILLNIVRGDVSRLTRSPNEIHRRCKPLERLYERDIVLYAHYNKLKYFSTECTYFVQSHRGYLRNLIKDLECVDPKCIQNINTALNREIGLVDCNSPRLGKCIRCNGPSSMNICKACNLEEGLSCDIPLLGVGKTEKIRRKHELEQLVYYK